MLKHLLPFFLCSVTMGYSQSYQDSVAARNQLKQELKTEILQELKTEGQEVDTTSKKKVNVWDRFGLKGYGVVNYYNNNYDTDPNLKNKIDAERLNLYLTYRFNDWITFKSEIEFEHGGTGSSIELDNQEEFGEYEQEIEKGGAVKAEQININFAIKPYFNVRAGRLKLYFGLAQKLDEPTEYFTTTRPEMEAQILPLGWYENGIEFHGNFLKDKFTYHLTVTNGLDASGFSSRNWIKFGYQEKFELVNAEAIAVMGRLDYNFSDQKNNFVGVSGYLGNSAPNRPKNDMNVPAYVSLVEAHINYDQEYLRFNSMLLFGNLQNSDIVSKANSSLSNNLGVKRNPVGKNALGFSAEVGYEMLHFVGTSTKQKIYPFARYDYYDTMFRTEGNVVDKPRWERNAITGGINWFIIPEVVVKAQYQDRRLGSENFDPATLSFTGEKQREKTFSVGIGFEF